MRRLYALAMVDDPAGEHCPECYEISCTAHDFHSHLARALEDGDQ